VFGLISPSFFIPLGWTRIIVSFVHRHFRGWNCVWFGVIFQKTRLFFSIFLVFWSSEKERDGINGIALRQALGKEFSYYFVVCNYCIPQLHEAEGNNGIKSNQISKKKKKKKKCDIHTSSPTYSLTQSIIFLQIQSPFILIPNPNSSLISQNSSE
jgi:hypothetical protein